MPFLAAPNALETSTTTGTGDIALTAAKTGFIRFSAAIGVQVGDLVNYSIRAVDANDVPTGAYEMGIGRYSAADTLARTLVIESSNADALVDFASGTKLVALTRLADGMSELLKHSSYPWYSNDFCGVASGTVAPFFATSNSGGTNNTPTAGVQSANHPGLNRLTSSTTANSGVAFYLGTNDAIRLGGGEVYTAVFRPEVFTDTTLRAGFIDTNGVGGVVDGVYFQYSTSGVITGRTRNNSTESVTATLATLSIATWYRLLLWLDLAIGNANFFVLSETGSVLGSATLGTNIPTASGRETGVGFNIENIGTVATDLCHIDYLGFGWLRKLNR